MSNLVAKSHIMRIEAAMAEQEQVELPVKHIFSEGLYARELFIPKGVMITGKIHRFECLNVMAYGHMRVFSDKGETEPFELVGYNIMTSPPGLKRIGLALEDTLWTTFHATNETDPDKLEELLTMPDENTKAIKLARARLCQ